MLHALSIFPSSQLHVVLSYSIFSQKFSLDNSSNYHHILLYCLSRFQHDAEVLSICPFKCRTKKDVFWKLLMPCFLLFLHFRNKCFDLLRVLIIFLNCSQCWSSLLYLISFSFFQGRIISTKNSLMQMPLNTIYCYNST